MSDFAAEKRNSDGYTGTCKECIRTYIKSWKRKNKSKLNARRREKYRADRGQQWKERENKRKNRDPIWYRSQLLRYGMIDRSKKLDIDFDSKKFTTEFIYKHLKQNPYCECCHRHLVFSFEKKQKGPQNLSPSVDRFIPENGYVEGNISFLCWRCNNLKRDATIQELKILIEWMESK